MESTGSVEARAFGDRPIVSSNRPGRARRESGQLSTPRIAADQTSRGFEILARARKAQHPRSRSSSRPRPFYIRCMSKPARSLIKREKIARVRFRKQPRLLAGSAVPRAYLSGFHQVWKPTRTPIGSSLACVQAPLRGPNARRRPPSARPHFSGLQSKHRRY